MEQLNYRAQETAVSPEPESSPRLLLTIDEAARQLHVSRWSVYNLIRANKLRTVKIGRRRLVTPAALTACVEHLAEEVA